MSAAFDDHALERACETYRLALPRTAMSGRIGGVLGKSAGGSLELQDFRAYQPGDDVRQVDWNAVARTDQLVVRVRREEISPRVELVVDVSRSMAVSDAKAVRVRELAWLFWRLARAQGLEPALVLASAPPLRQNSWELQQARTLTFDAALPLSESLRQAPLLRPCGVRVVVSDFLFDSPLDPLVTRLAANAGRLACVQVLDASDLAPEPGGTLTLVDSETGERIERELDENVIAAYLRRFELHQSALKMAARRVQAVFVQASASDALETALRTQLLGNLLEVQA